MIIGLAPPRLLLASLLLLVGHCQQVRASADQRPTQAASGEQEEGANASLYTSSATGAHCQRWQADANLEARNEPPAWSANSAAHKREAEFCRQRRETTGAPNSQELRYSWRFKYVDEQGPGVNEVRVLEESLDERLANLLHTTSSISIFNADFHNFRSGNAQEDAANVRLAASPETNDQLCGQHMASMLDILEQLEARLELKRQNASVSLDLAEQHVRLARVLDAFGHYESGMMVGRTHSIGNYQQCVSSALLLEPPEEAPKTRLPARAQKVPTRYCWARLEASKHQSPQLAGRKLDPHEAAEQVFMAAVCLPESCHTRSFLPATAGEQTASRNRELARRLINSQFKLPKSLFIDESLELNSLYCLQDPKEGYSLSLAGKLTLSLLVSWLLIACYATYYQEQRRLPRANKSDVGTAIVGQLVDQSQWAQELLDCLNLKKSYQDFIEEPYEQRTHERAAGPANRKRVVLNVLNPIKAICSAYTVYYHSFLILLSFSMDRLGAFNQFENDPVITSMIPGTFGLDTMFVISGLLVTYTRLQKAASRRPEKNGTARRLSPALADGQVAISSKQTATKPLADHEPTDSSARATGRREGSMAVTFLKQWAGLVLQRVLRLVPFLFVVYAVKRTILVELGRGWPFWDDGFNRDTYYGSCRRESWLVPFNMMSAYLPLSQQCLLQSWSLAVDLFFILAVSPLILLLRRKPRLALLLALVMGSVSYVWSVHLHQTMPAHMFAELGNLRAHGYVFVFGSMSGLYTFAHIRFPSLLVGFVAGYALHRYQQADEPNWPQWLRGSGTKFALGFLLFTIVATVVGTKYRVYFQPYGKILIVHILTTCRILWAVSNAILFLRMATDWKDSYLMKQSAAGFWSKAIKINMPLLLIHMDVLMFYMGSADSLGYFNKRNLLSLFGAAYMVCLPLALLVHIVYENPLNKLINRHIKPWVAPQF